MPDIILPPGEDQSQEHLVLTTTSNAAANGVDTNSATARLSHHGRPSSGRQLTFTLSGNALFSQGGQRAVATTDDNGEATVFFTDTEPEIVEVNCLYRQGHTREVSRFIESSRADYGISAEILRNNAEADGSSSNALRYTVYAQSGAHIPNIVLTFLTTGNAVLSATTGATNANGQYDLSVRNSTVQDIIVSTALRDFPNVINHTFMNFIQPKIYTLTADRIIAQADANGVEYAILEFKLTLNNIPAPNQLLQFTSSSSTAQLTFPNGRITNQMGAVSIHITNTTPESVYITATTVNVPLSTDPVTSFVTFTALPLNQYWILIVTRDKNMPANGVAQNSVDFILNSYDATIPVAGIPLVFTVTNGARLSTYRGITERDGRCRLSLTNTTPGPVRITARLESLLQINSNYVVTFI